MGNKTLKADTIELLPSEEVATINVSHTLSYDQDDIIVVWYSTTVDSTIKKESFSKISNDIRFFYNENECIHFIETIKEKIFLIISSEIHQDLLIKFNSSNAIYSIFIYSNSNEITIDTLSKIVGIYTCQSDLIQSIRENIRVYEKESAVFSLYKHKSKHTRDLTEESGSFLFFQVFKNVLLNMPQTNESKKEMIETCQIYCRQDATKLKEIEIFNKTYKATEAIKWYTENSFAYRLVNAALRTGDIQALHAFRFFIIDLSTNLSSMDNIFKKQQQQQTLKLYRGCILSTSEVQRLNDNVGNLISHNGFLSTSRLYDIAVKFTKKPKTSLQESVIFEIDVDLNNANNIILADIAQYSKFPEEQEVLFDIGISFSFILSDL